MRRIMIVGHPGAGKSTFALALGRALGLPVYHMDQLLWQSPGKLRGEAELAAIIAEIVSQDGYILEGARRQTYAVRLAGCDTLIWLDHWLPLCAYRVWRRAAADRRQGLVSADPTGRLPGDPPLLRMLARHRRRQRDLLDLMANARAKVGIFQLRSRRQVRRFLADVVAEGSAGN